MNILAIKLALNNTMVPQIHSTSELYCFLINELSFTSYTSCTCLKQAPDQSVICNSAEEIGVRKPNVLVKLNIWVSDVKHV